MSSNLSNVIQQLEESLSRFDIRSPEHYVNRVKGASMLSQKMVAMPDSYGVGGNDLDSIKRRMKVMRSKSSQDEQWSLYQIDYSDGQWSGAPYLYVSTKDIAARKAARSDIRFKLLGPYTVTAKSPAKFKPYTGRQMHEGDY